MKATAEIINGKFEVIGLDFVKEEYGVKVYEMRYLHSFGGKTYKTLANAIKAIERKGFEYVDTFGIKLVASWN